MFIPTNRIFIDDCRGAYSTWAVSGLVYLNSEDEPADMGISCSFESNVEALAYAKSLATGSRLDSSIVVNGSLGKKVLFFNGGKIDTFN
jgi:hypothetical protein